MSQNEFIARIIVVLTVQGAGVFILFLLAYLTLKKEKTLLTRLLSLFFIFLASGFGASAIFLPIQTSPLSLFLYEMCLFLISISYGFLILFSYNLVTYPKTTPWWKLMVIFTIFAIGILISFFIPNGVSYDSYTNWVPIYSWTFSTYLMIYITVIVIPQTYLSLKIYRKMRDETLKQKFRLFLIGVFLIFANLMLNRAPSRSSFFFLMLPMY